MDIPNTSFKEWEKEHYSELLAEYHHYLRSVVAEWDDVDMTEVEDYATWAREEYALLKEHGKRSN